MSMDELRIVLLNQPDTSHIAMGYNGLGLIQSSPRNVDGDRESTSRGGPMRRRNPAACLSCCKRKIRVRFVLQPPLVLFRN